MADTSPRTMFTALGVLGALVGGLFLVTDQADAHAQDTAPTPAASAAPNQGPSGVTLDRSTCTTLHTSSKAEYLSCEGTRPYRGRTLHCVESPQTGQAWAPDCDYPRFYAENPDLAARDAAAGKLNATTNP